jgi:hypothetical protein
LQIWSWILENWDPPSTYKSATISDLVITYFHTSLPIYVGSTYITEWVTTVKPDSHSVEIPMVLFLSLWKTWWKNPSGQSQLVTWRLSVTRKFASCWMWWVTSCKMYERERERELQSVWNRLTLVKLKKPNFSYKTSLTCGRESCNYDFLLTDWMAKSYKRAYQSFISKISILQPQPPIWASISVYHIQHIMLIIPLISPPQTTQPIYLWRKVVCFVL